MSIRARHLTNWRASTRWLLILYLLATPEPHIRDTQGPHSSCHLLARAAAPDSQQAPAPAPAPAGDGDSALPQGGGHQTAPAPSRPLVRRFRASRCPGNCTLYGTCHEELGRCDCPRDREGPDCSSQLTGKALLERCKKQGYKGLKDCLDPDQACVNGCNNRGQCVAGFCHCKPGRYGSDCSLSLGHNGRPVLLGGSGYTTRAKRPWVYVYELPSEMAVWYNFKRLDRPLHLYIWQRLLSSGARTADGDAADYYMLPVMQRCTADSYVLRDAIQYVAARYPWWNRTGGGHRHLAVHTGDWGRAELTVAVQNLTANMNWLTHWGLTQNRSTMARWTATFRPDKDVVIPVFVSSGHLIKFGVSRSPLHPATRQRPRNISTLFFAGRICHEGWRPTRATWPHCGDDTEEWYAAGIREKVFVSHWNRSGFHLVRSEPRYANYMARSPFCLAPPGAGHGQRQIQALFMGCVPVTVGDHIYEPFEPALSWDDWGLRVAEDDIPRMHTLLAEVTTEQLQEKQSRMHCAAQHMLYSSVTGAILGEDGRYDAFETTLEVLRVRAVHPDAPPERFRELDPDFDAFMDCRDPPGFVRLSGLVSEAEAEKDEKELGALEEEEWEEEGGDLSRVLEGGKNRYEGNQDGSRQGVGAVISKGGVQEGLAVGGRGRLGSSRARSASVGEVYQRAAKTSASSGSTARNMTIGGSGGPAPGRVGKPPPKALCSHATVDMRRREAACYHILRGSGYMGIPGGAICARGYRTRLAACPRLWG